MKRYLIMYALMASLLNSCNEELERDDTSLSGDLFVIQVPRSHILEARGLDLPELQPVNLFQEYQHERKSTRKSLFNSMPQHAQEQQFLDSYEPYAFVDVKKLLQNTNCSLASRTNSKDPQCILFARPKIKSHVNVVEVEKNSIDDTACGAELELPILADQESIQDSIDDIEQYKQSLGLEKNPLIYEPPQYQEPVYGVQSSYHQPLAMMPYPYQPQQPMVQQPNQLAAYAMQLQATAMAMQAQASSMIMQSQTSMPVPLAYPPSVQYGYPIHSAYGAERFSNLIPTQDMNKPLVRSKVPEKLKHKSARPPSQKEKMRTLVMHLHDLSKKSEYDLQRLLLVLDIELDIIGQLISGKRGALIEQLLRDKKNYLDTFGPFLRSVYQLIMEMATAFDHHAIDSEMPQQSSRRTRRQKKESLHFNRRKFLYTMLGKLEQIYQLIQSIH